VAGVAAIAKPTQLPELRLSNPGWRGDVPELRLDSPSAVPVTAGSSRGGAEEKPVDVVDGVPYWLRRNGGDRYRRHRRACVGMEFVHGGVQRQVEENQCGQRDLD